MIKFMIAGLVLGGIYALSAASVTITYVTTGVLNLAFASLAYFLARFYYFLLAQHGWPIWAAAIMAIVVAGPVLGVVLYAVLFRFLRRSNSLIKLVATIGLSVALPPLAVIIFGNVTILSAPGLSPQPVPTYTIFGTAITLNQVIAYACVAIVLIVGVAILRFTEVGLKVRAAVDSEAVTSLSGTNPSRVALSVWAVSVFLAGLAGVLIAPIINISSANYEVLVASAFAAVIVAKLRSIGIAVLTAFAMGAIEAIAQWAIPPSSSIIQAITPSIPFAVIVVFLGYQLIRGRRLDDSTAGGGPVDNAIRSDAGLSALHNAASTMSLADSAALATMAVPVAAPASGHAANDHVTAGTPAPVVAAAPGSAGTVSFGKSLIGSRSVFSSMGGAEIFAVVVLGVIALFPVFFSTFWANQVAPAMAIALIMLSMTLVAGQGGMIWLCQITFAGVGALAAAQLATRHGWPILGAMVVVGLVAAAMGTVIGYLTIRLGDLYVALATLTFGVLMSTLVFPLAIFNNFGEGVSVYPPTFVGTGHGLDWMAIVIFAMFGVIAYVIRHSTAGMALSAVRSSRTAAESVGINVVGVKVVISGFAAFVAAIGGCLLALNTTAVLGTSFNVFTGLVIFAVIVTLGIRSGTGAMIGGISYVYLPAIFVTYLPKAIDQVPTALFGLGAILVAKNPDGVISMHGRQFRALGAMLSGKGRRQPMLAPAGLPHEAAPASADVPVTTSEVVPS